MNGNYLTKHYGIWLYRIRKELPPFMTLEDLKKWVYVKLKPYILKENDFIAGAKTVNWDALYHILCTV